MKHVSGWNFMFQSLSTNPISYLYFAMGIKSNFLSNVNFMAILVAVGPVMWAVLTVAGRVSQSYKTRPRLLRQAKIFLL